MIIRKKNQQIVFGKYNVSANDFKNMFEVQHW